ncbi:MAG: SpvB/TcaC N-terminal domain-containing protein, partial [Desulfuromonadaceae bacterium]
MFRYKKFKTVTASLVLAAMCMQPFAAWAAAGAAPVAAAEPEMVKLLPVAVSVDTSALPPKLADDENKAVWRIFDCDTASVYTPAQTTRVTVTLAEAKNISRLRVFGAPSFQLNVYRDNGGSWESVPSLSGLTLETLSKTSWNTLPAAASFAAANLLLEFIPLGNVAVGIAELEFWGADTASSVDASRVTLEGIRTPQEAAGILDRKASHIFEVPATPSEITLPDGSAGDGFAAVSFTLSQHPSLFKRAYLLYEGNNIITPTAVQRSINNLTWSGGFAMSQPEGTTPSWEPLIEEINPAWLLQGDNSIRFRSPNGPAYIRNLRVVIETDSGWNSVASVSSPALYDGDVSTSYEIHAAANPALQITFERPVEPEKIRLHLHAPAHLKAGLQYSTGGSWQEVKPGWQLNLSTLQPGWNDIALPAQVTTTALRLVFDTGSLRLKTGVPTGAIDELRVAASPAGSLSAMPRIVVSYPRNGEFFGRTAYLQGFATPSLSVASTAEVNVEGKVVANQDGAFSIPLTKDETGFSAQPDDEAWSAQVKSEYAGQPGAGLTVPLTRNSGNTAAADPKKESRGDAPFADKRDKYSEKVAPGQARKIKYRDVTLDIPEGAVDQETEITIIPLTEADLARLNPGMINVTHPAAGYRFLPHGMKFKKPIKISFGYSKQLFAAGQTDNDVTMYYYNEQYLRWEALTRATVDPAASAIVSESDHFTDIINSTLVVPEHPQALSFNPNSIKDIKAADPAANVNLIEPPKANNRGTANLSYPIEVPAGRNRIQPGLGVQYNSGGGNGWMGLGWDIPLQSISIDTRWGVPRYDKNDETETYTLDGEQLTPLAHRGTFQSRTAEKVFHTRVEGQFRKIIRHGTAPNNYWWEVTDKNGTRYSYGGVPGSEATLADPANGNIFKWALRQVRDTNGNTMNYGYSVVANTGLEKGTIPGFQMYLKKIDYTGHDDKPGAYTVVFNRDRELPDFVQRQDVSIDARSGFKMVTADLLRNIEVYFGGSYGNGTVTGGSLVRRYEFKYNEDAYGDRRPGTAFNKTLLTSVAQYGKDGGLFNTHRFTYFDEARNPDGSYHGFAATPDWSVGTDGVSAGLFNHGNASALGGTQGSSLGAHLYVGVGLLGNLMSKENTVGAKIGYSDSNSESVLTMADMDGDGLPDKVFKADDGFYYRKNLSGPHGSNTFGADRVLIAGLTAISEEEVTSITFGVEEYFAGTSALSDTNKATTNADTYFSDVNGDGLIDLVSGGQVLFGYLNTKQEPTFGANSTLTPVPIGSGTIDTTGLLEDPADEEAERSTKFPVLDTVRRWVAPYDGTVSINAPVNLIDTSKEKGDYDGADGVQVAIQLEGDELWSTRTVQVTDPRDATSARLIADDYTTHTPPGVGNIQVKRGDRIYFRVQSVFDGKFDRVSWDPEITYLNEDTSSTDANGLAAYVYRASREFTLAGRQGTVAMPLTGTLHMEGTLTKNGAATDDVTLVITRNGTEVYRHILGAAESSSVDITQDLAVTKLDELQFKILVDSPVDASLVRFDPIAYYTAASGLDTVKNEKGEYILKVSVPYSMDLYPADDLTAPQKWWKAPQSGDLVVTPSLAFLNGISDAQVVFTVKKRGVLLGKGNITIGKDANGAIMQTPLSLTVPVAKDDELFFDFSSRDMKILQYLASSTVQVTYDSHTFETVPSAFHGAVAEGAFPAPFRGWGAVGYNGNSPRDAKAIDQSLLIIDDSFDAKTAMVYPFVPVPAADAWGGLDDGVWVKALQTSTARLGLDDIRLPRSENFAGAAAPSRISKSKNNSISGSFGGVGGGYSKGSSESKLDFMDLNGDRFPDVVSQSGVQYTRPDGALEVKKNNDVNLGTPRSTKNETYQGSLNSGSIAGAIANARSNVAPSGGGGASSASHGSEMPTFNVDGSYGTSNTDYDLIDINGDGLADKVYDDGKVSLNLGYSFSFPPELWEGGVVNDGQTTNGGIGMGFNMNSYSIAGGLGLSLGSTRSDETYVDINGDGLPDKVSGGSARTVRLNRGGGFSNPIYWPGGQGKVAEDAHINLNGGVYFTYGFPVWLIKIVINIGVNYSDSMGRPEYAFRDMDGDGFVDHVYSDDDSMLRVASNPIGRTNILKSVKRPLGGKFDLEYTREGNVYEMPQSQWLLTGVNLSDGMGRSYRSGYA